MNNSRRHSYSPDRFETLKRQLDSFIQRISSECDYSSDLTGIVADLKFEFEDFFSGLESELSARDYPSTMDRGIPGVLLENSPDLIFLLDTDGRVTYFNRAVAATFTDSTQNLIGSNVFESFIVAGISEMAELNRRHPKWPANLECTWRDRAFSITLFPCSPRGNDLHQFAMLARDTTELKAARRELERQRDEYENLFNSVNSMIFFKDREGRQIKANRRPLENTDYAMDDIKGKRIDDSFPHKGQEFRKSDTEVLEKGKPLLHQIESYTTASGQERWARTDKYPYYENGTGPSGIVTFAQDVTQRIKAEENEKCLLIELRDRARIMEEILSSSPDIFFMIDDSLNCNYINANGARRLGLEHGDLIYKPLDEIGLNTGVMEELRKPSELVMKTGIPLTAEIETDTAGGIRDYKYTISPIHSKDDIITSVAITATDITATREIQKSLEDSRARYKSLFNDNHAVMMLIDPETGEIVDANRAACEFYRYSREKLLKKNIVEISTLERDSLFERMQLITAMKAQHLFSKHRLSSGEVRSIEAYVGLINFDDRNLIYSIIHDISEKIHAEIMVDETLKKLEKALDNTIHVISKVSETKDPYTAGHQKRVSILAVEIARELGLDLEKIYEIKVSSLLHDIGKIGIPTDLLSKPGRLSSIEFSLIKQHCEIGSDIVVGLEFPWNISDVVSQHHERLNGTGYPRGLKGDEITLSARIVAVADVVEAMASHRPYRPALGVEAALNEIRKNSGVLYDSEVVQSCCQVFEHGFTFDSDQGFN